jgi:hypothetical protein
MESETTTAEQTETPAQESEPGDPAEVTEAQAETSESSAAHPADALPEDQPAEEPVTAPTPEAPKDEPPVEQKPEPKPDAWLVKHLADIEACNRDVLRRKERWEEAKDEASACKKDYDEAVDFLTKTISNITTPAPLFDQVNTAANPQLACDHNHPENIAPENQPDDPDAWKSVPVGELVPDAKVAALLAENGVITFERVEAWRASRYEDPKIRGLGEAKKQVIEDAIVAYWVKNPRPVAPAAALAAAVLVWFSNGTLDDEVKEVWSAANTAGIVDADLTNAKGDASPAEFIIEVRKNGQINLDLSHDLLLPTSFPELLPTLDEAKAWCESRNAALIAGLPDNPAADIDAGHPFIGASGKNWALKIATHERSDGTHATACDIRIGEITN